MKVPVEQLARRGFDRNMPGAGVSFVEELWKPALEVGQLRLVH